MPGGEDALLHSLGPGFEEDEEDGGHGGRAGAGAGRVGGGAGGGAAGGGPHGAPVMQFIPALAGDGTMVMTASECV